MHGTSNTSPFSSPFSSAGTYPSSQTVQQVSNSHSQYQHVRQLTKQDPVYSKLEYQLRLSLNSVSAAVLRIFSIERISTDQNMDLTMISYFDPKDNNESIMDCWINVDTQLPAQGKNSLEHLIEKGSFSLSEHSGINIVTGDIREFVLGMKYFELLSAEEQKQIEQQEEQNTIHTIATSQHSQQQNGMFIGEGTPSFSSLQIFLQNGS